MAGNVWMVIWPNQKKALGIVTATDDEKEEGGAHGVPRLALQPMLSLPMLFAMLGMRHFADLIS